MIRKVIKSKLLRSVAYDAATRTLEIEFLRRQNEETRPVYRYLDVPPERFNEMMHGSGDEQHSIGSYYLRMIKPNYKFEKVEEPREDQKESAGGSTPPEAA